MTQDLRNAAYIKRTYDYLKPDIRDVLKHTKFLYEPIIHGNFKDSNAFLRWFQANHSSEYEQYLASSSIQNIPVDKRILKRYSENP